MSIRDILLKAELTRQDIIDLLSSKKSEDIELLRTTAEKMLLQQRGSEVYFRGLVEFSNICKCDCFYCGIRKGNTNVKRYLLTKEQIVKASLWCADQGYGSVVFQSGERNDDAFIDFVEDVVLTVKEKTKSKTLPNGIGITLCVGEQTENTYQRFYNAGAHRYLLRIESSSPDVFRTIHPVNQTIENRIRCLKNLKKIGYRTGTGVMIGIPGQSIENLADDILFFQEINADMIGMGPYIVHSQTPMAKFEEEIKSRADEIFLQSLKMIAVTRLVLKNVNIAATTALQSMVHNGRELGLSFGANVIMPQLTPTEVRKEYLLYEGKPCLDENAEECRNCLTRRITSINRIIGYNKWGDRH